MKILSNFNTLLIKPAKLATNSSTAALRNENFIYDNRTSITKGLTHVKGHVISMRTRMCLEWSKVSE